MKKIQVSSYISLLLCIVQALILPVTAQTITKGPNYTLRHYTDEHGLPQNTVRAIAQDRDGFVWLATEMGLARFDGQSFVVFDKSNSGLRSNQITAFTSDLEGRTDRLYALSADVEHIKISAGRAMLEKNLLEYHFDDMPKNKYGAGEWAYSIGLPDPYAGKWPISRYLFLFPNSKGSFYMWRKGGEIDLYENWKKQRTYKTNKYVPFGIFRLGKNLYHDNRRGNIELLAVSSKSVERQKEVKLTPKRPQDGGPDLTKPYVVYSQDLSGQVFICQNQTLYLLSHDAAGDIQTSVLLSHFNFQETHVISMFFDEKKGRLFMGTPDNGLFILDLHIFQTLTVASKEPWANIFYSHIAYTDSTVLTPSFQVLGKKATGETIRYDLPELVKGLSPNINTVLISRTGDIWYRNMNVLHWYDGKNKKLKGAWTVGTDGFQIYEDGGGLIWLGTYKNGLLYIDPREKGAPVHTFTSKLKDIIFLLEDGADILWVATATGLFKISRDQKTFFLVPNTGDIRVKGLYLYKNGELWFNTSQHGLFLLQGDRLTRLPLDKKKILVNSHCFIGDKNGFLWITTNHGLFRISRQDALDFTVHKDSTRLYYHRFSKRHGFRIDEFNGNCEPCAVRLKNGYVSLPSIDGMVFFKPEQVPLDLPDSKIFIDRVEADSREVPVGGSKIELTDINNIQVFVSSPYLGDRANQQLYYSVSSDRKADIKEIWYSIENAQQSILLNNLESGTYTLKIRKNSGPGTNRERLTTLTIVIPYAWYEKWPFKALVVLMALGAIYFYFKNRLKKVNRLNKILELRVSERTQNLQDTLGALKTSEQELIKQTRLQMHLIASISHDIRSPLRSIEFASSKVHELVQKGEYSLVETVGSSVNESSRKILQLLENMLSYVKSQAFGGSVAYEMLPLRKLVDEVTGVFAEVFGLRQNKLINNVPEALAVRSNQQLLKIILHNLIDNANKFTSDGTISVNAIRTGEVVTLSVSDTGPGLPDAILTWFNEGDVAYLESLDDELSLKGIGLVIVKELADLLKLQIQAVSVSGATFSIGFVR